MRLVQIQKITGVIHCETNLHIGGSKDDIEIGGMDNPIIRHPLTGEFCRQGAAGLQSPDSLIHPARQQWARTISGCSGTWQYSGIPAPR